MNKLNIYIKVKIFILLIFLFLFFRCKDKDVGNCKLKICNKSNENISWILSYGYPDTMLFNDTILRGAGPSEGDVIQPNSTGSIYRDDDWSLIFSNDLPSDTLIVFIFNTDTLYNVSWVKVAKEYKILKRFDLSYADLDSLGWVLTYP